MLTSIAGVSSSVYGLWALAAVIGLLLTWLFPRWARYLNKRKPGRVLWYHALIMALSWPIVMYYWLVFFMFILHFLFVRAGYQGFAHNIPKVHSFILLVIMFWLAMRTLSRYESLFKIAIASGKVSYNQTTVRALMQVGRTIVVIAFLLSALQTLGVKISALLAVSGIGGLAVSFAAKDNVANFLGGMMIFIDRPFSVGDWISSPDRNIEGTVEAIGWRLTKIMTFEKRPLYVPNGVFSTIVVVNPSCMTNRRIKTNIGVRYDDAQVVAPILADVEQMLHQHEDIDQKPYHYR